VVTCRVAGDKAGLAAAIAVGCSPPRCFGSHYLVLLFVPLALYRPVLSWPWLVPTCLWVTICLWVTPSTGPHGVTWRICAVSAAIVIVWIWQQKSKGTYVMAAATMSQVNTSWLIVSAPIRDSGGIGTFVGHLQPPRQR
jgi:hypothetical protein